MKRGKLFFTGIMMTSAGLSFIFIFCLAIYFSTTSGMNEVREVSVPLKALEALIGFVIMAIGLLIVFHGLGKDKGYEQGLEDGENGLIASLIDKGVISEISKVLPAGDYKLLKTFKESDTISCGLLLDKSSNSIRKVSYYEKDYPLRRLKEAQEFMVNAEGVMMIEVAGAFVDGYKAFIKF